MFKKFAFLPILDFQFQIYDFELTFRASERFRVFVFVLFVCLLLVNFCSSLLHLVDVDLPIDFHFKGHSLVHTYDLSIAFYFDTSFQLGFASVVENAKVN